MVEVLDRDAILEVLTAFVMSTLPDDFIGDIELCYNEKGEVEVWSMDDRMN